MHINSMLSVTISLVDLATELVTFRMQDMTPVRSNL